MHLKSNKLQARENNKPRILVVGPIFPMGGGVGMVNKILLESYGLNEDFEMYHLNTSRGKAGSDQVGTLALINLYHFAGQAFRLTNIDY
jgi:hypothetical protein